MNTKKIAKLILREFMFFLFATFLGYLVIWFMSGSGDAPDGNLGWFSTAVTLGLLAYGVGIITRLFIAVICRLNE